MRTYPLTLLLVIALVVIVGCQPDPSLVQSGPRLVGEREIGTDDAAPTLFMLPTRTPVIVPTSAPTEVVGVPIATANNAEFILITPTLQPSKTPTITPTQTVLPTITQTPTATATITASPTSQQFTFSGLGQASPAEATAFAEGALAARALARSSGAPLAPQQVVSAPVQNCSGSNWFFSQYAPSSCPVEEPVFGQGVFQRFENGYMVWLEATDKIYVMYNSAEQPRWVVFDDPYVEGAEELDYAWHTKEQQPPQTWQPRRGFGEVWRQNEDVRFRIGWAVQQWETIYTPRFQRAQDNSASIEDPYRGVFYLAPSGTDWDLYRYQ